MNKKQYLPLPDNIARFESITNDRILLIGTRQSLKQKLFYNLLRFTNASQTLRILNEIHEFI